MGVLYKPRTAGNAQSAPKVSPTDVVLPSLVLCNNARHFGTLFELLELPEAADQAEEVWMLLMRLPTEEALLGGLESLQAVKTPQPDWNALLDSTNIYKLLYQLQIMESLVQPAGNDGAQDSAMVDDGGALQEAQLKDRATWRKKFLLYGGFDHLYSILIRFDKGIQEGPTARQDHPWLRDLSYVMPRDAM